MLMVTESVAIVKYNVTFAIIVIDYDLLVN
jgi:hypothetical protein